jgi:hypothetical protein
VRLRAKLLATSLVIFVLGYADILKHMPAVTLRKNDCGSHPKSSHACDFD